MKKYRVVAIVGGRRRATTVQAESETDARSRFLKRYAGGKTDVRITSCRENGPA